MAGNLTADEARVLLLPPTSRDAAVLCKLLATVDMRCTVAADMADLCGHLAAGGAGVVLVSEESLAGGADALAAALAGQPVWSDLPVVVLSRSGAEQPALTAVLGRLGNVTVVERPVRVTTLVSLVRSAQRARARQYQVREHLAERAAVEADRAALFDAERAARAEAERASRMKDEFLATLSHELRTPLNAILGWSQILRSGPSPADPDLAADLAEGLGVIERNARAQTQIIEDLLDMSRIISGKVRLDVRPTDLAGVVRASVETVKPTADAKGVGLVAAIAEVVVPADPNRLQQVFWNLLTNAIKFTPRGGRVEVALTPADDGPAVTVSDSGDGIGPEFLPFVFDRFRQADASTTRQHGGLGLGLAIVKQIVELHGGTVAVASGGPGRGTTFTVRLPAAAVNSAAAGDEPRPAVPAVPTDAAGRTDPAVDRSVVGLRVLAVDDEPDARHLVRRLLEDHGAVVTLAGSAADAFAAFVADPPDVLVSDIGMPGGDGYGLIRRVRSLAADAGGRVPAVAVTAYARSEDCALALAAGFQMHLSKPIEPVQLLAAVAAVRASVIG